MHYFACGFQNGLVSAPCLACCCDQHKPAHANTTPYQTVGMSLSAPNKIRLPPLESIWRWPRYVSPHLAEIEEECLQWSASFGAFDPDTQRLIHEYGKLSEFLSKLPPFRHSPRSFVPNLAGLFLRNSLLTNICSDLLAGMCYARMPKGRKEHKHYYYSPPCLPGQSGSWVVDYNIREESAAV